MEREVAMEKVFLSDVLKAIKKAYIWNDDISQQILEKEITQLPSAEKTGEWTYKDDDVFAGEYACSNCKRRAEVDTYGQWILSNYCPNCGARMKGEI